MVTPLVRVKSIKKRTKRFQRHQSDRKIAVKVRTHNCARACAKAAVAVLHARAVLGLAGRWRSAVSGSSSSGSRQLPMSAGRQPRDAPALTRPPHRRAPLCRRRAGAGPRVLTRACAGSSRDAASSCPTLATAPTRRRATCCPTVRAAPISCCCCCLQRCLHCQCLPLLLLGGAVAAAVARSAALLLHLC